MDLYEKLASNPAVENCFPKFIARINGENVVVATVLHGSVYLTDEGEKFIVGDAQKASEKQPRQRKAKNAPVVEEAADELSEINDLEIGGDLNFDE